MFFLIDNSSQQQTRNDENATRNFGVILCITRCDTDTHSLIKTQRINTPVDLKGHYHKIMFVIPDYNYSFSESSATMGNEKVVTRDMNFGNVEKEKAISEMKVTIRTM